MQTLGMIVVLLGFLGFIGGLVLLVLSFINKKPKKKPGMVLLASFVAFIIGTTIVGLSSEQKADVQQAGRDVEEPGQPVPKGPITGNLESTKKPKSTDATSTSTKREKEILEAWVKQTEIGTQSRPTPEPKARAVDEVVRDLVLKNMGRKANWDGSPDRVISVEKTSQVGGGLLVDVRYRLDENLTVGLVRFGMLNEAMQFLRELYRTPGCESVVRCRLVPHLTLVDAYGQKADDQVAIIEVDRAMAERINWENMYVDKFKDLLVMNNRLWLHPAIR